MILESINSQELGRLGRRTYAEDALRNSDRRLDDKFRPAIWAAHPSLAPDGCADCAVDKPGHSSQICSLSQESE